MQITCIIMTSVTGLTYVITVGAKTTCDPQRNRPRVLRP